MHESDPNPKLPPITYESLVEPLIWPRLLRVPAMALAPRRFALCVIAVVLFAMFERLAGGSIEGAERLPVVSTLASGVLAVLSTLPTLDLGFVQETITRAFARPLWELVLLSPVVFSITGLVILAVYSIVGAAVGRATALELARGERQTIFAALRYGVSGGRATFASLLLPLVAASIVGMVMWGVGALGAWASVVIFLLAIPLVFGLALHTLAAPLLPASVACERSDTMDALQRVYAYILTAPLRAAVYGATALLVSLLAHAVFVFVLAGATDIAEGLAGVDAPPGQSVVDGALAFLAGGYALSLFFTSGAVVYLLIRRVCDEQDVADIVIEPTGRVSEATR